MKRAINAANLHVGGGVQVAVSFLHELALQPELAARIAVFASAKVDGELKAVGCDVERFQSYVVIDMHGLMRGARALYRELDRHDVVLTVFGPLYRWSPPFRSVVGFAQAWILYPDNESEATLPRLARWRQRAKFWIQKQFFRRADELIAELEHVRDGLVRRLGYDARAIHLVRNSVSSLYRQPEAWRPVSMPRASCDLRLGFVGRNYPHKNTAIFPGIVALLRQRHGIEAKVYVTFNEAEWEACPPEFQASCVNAGPLSVTQCPAFYQAVDAVIFPSLLECASATPLEAMAMGRPLFASDRPFNRDLCSRHARYFDPLSPESAAAAIAEWFREGGPDESELAMARRHALDFSNAGERARKYMAILLQGARQAGHAPTTHIGLNDEQ
jgi:glycosyltransferase involved in cell wall biosynthesis